jgi:ATP/maltotriose-dependent transcriptional regulator MalT
VIRRRGQDWLDAAPLLVEAKLEPPRVPRGVIDRLGTRAALDAGGDVVLTLVAAPAGYGKTTAVRSWCATQEAALVWVTLDVGDDDPTRLWRHLATAMDRVRPGLGQPALRRLAVGGSPIEDAVDELTNAVATYANPLTIVLDDLDAVTDEESLTSIDYALPHVTPNARLIVMTRADPALSLARLRGRGELAELRADDLAFNHSEARELLVVRGGIELGDEEIDLLMRRTEGWPAALVLAGLWLRTVDDPASAVSVFGGDQRFIADYLTSEVLASLDAARGSFLEGAAVLGEFTAELCDAVLERNDSASELAELERANLFVSLLERGKWFRMHPLFAEYAQARLASTDPGARSRIHQQAAGWLRSQGLREKAVEHAAAAGEHEFVAQILVEDHLTIIRAGNVRTFVRQVRALPDECVVEHTELAVAAAVATKLAGGGTIEQRRFLRLADRALAKRPETSDPYVETAARMVRALTLDDGVKRAVVEGRLAVELAETGSDELLTAACTATARALYLAGVMEEARDAALRVLRHPEIERRPPSLAHASATLALVAVAQGRLDQARGHAEKAKAMASRIGITRSWLGANACAAMGAVLAAEGNLVEAERELATAAHFFEDDVPDLHHAWMLVLLAQVRIRRGRLDDGEAALGSARDDLNELPDSGMIAPLADDVEGELETARVRAGGGEVLERPSEAETAVLQLLAGDLTTREIAERLFLSPNTVRSHVHALYAKLGVHSRAEAVARATALGLLDEADSPR